MVLYAVAWQWAPQSIIATIDGLKAVSYPQDGSRECRFGGRCSTKDHLDAAGVAADMRMAWTASSWAKSFSAPEQHINRE